MATTPLKLAGAVNMSFRSLSLKTTSTTLEDENVPIILIEPLVVIKLEPSLIVELLIINIGLISL